MGDKCALCGNIKEGMFMPYEGELQWICESCKELLYYCHRCGKYKLYKDIVVYNHDFMIYYCTECMKNARYCKNCGHFFFISKFKNTGGYCPDCFNEYYEICSICNDVIRKYSAIYFPDQIVCKHCITRV